MRLAAAVAVLAGEVSLVPTLLPRRPWVQGIFTGVVMANTYAVVVALVLVAGVLRRRWVPGPAGRGPRSGRRWPAVGNVASWAGRAGILLLAAGFGAAVVAGRATAVLLAQRSDGPPPALHGQLVAAGLGLVVAVGLVLAARLGRLTVVAVVRRLIRSRVVTRIVVMVAVVAVVGAAGSDAPTVPSPGAHPTAAWAAAVQARPQVRSGGTGTLVPWASLGVKGQEFVASGPTAAGIEAVTGQPAIEPIRVYVGTATAPDAQARGRIALQELERTGAFSRSVIVLAVPTGSGWVNPAAPSALEYLYGGDVATVAIQYSAVPSWLEYLQGLGKGEETSHALLDTVTGHTAAMPAGERPRVILYGESLGALSALTALSTSAVRSDAALWVGVPAEAPLSDLSDQVRLIHPDDPVAIWSPRLLLGPTPQWRSTWMPLVSFWQATADMAAAYDIPNGHGHRYAREFVDAWNEIAPAGRRAGSVPAARYEAIRTAVETGDLPTSTASYSADAGTAASSTNERARTVARSPAAQVGGAVGAVGRVGSVATWTTPLALSATSR
jgi:uncharacterized membrane protein